jgi:hypothetical protein
LWNETPSDELKQFMDDIDATELHPDEAELRRWLEDRLSQKKTVPTKTAKERSLSATPGS